MEPGVPPKVPVTGFEGLHHFWGTGESIRRVDCCEYVFIKVMEGKGMVRKVYVRL